ncbi:hypothetical protein EVJ58_g8423 [Rhodofomes roseus]|uniref:Deacetylase sirtuin-type domain-containing protein n=1 Tax=Rhodofomes roseus TaxID=34475 RepID=A0A4Y9Y0B4_9APHY|nr:hypothetical protein EVJ58_g8423 [Rhodofomes roseus]
MVEHVLKSSSQAEGTTSMFCQMIAQLAELSEVALPTSFHHLLRALDERRRLLRVYTQNIDALEQKSGLTFGVPESDAKRNKPRLCKPKTDAQSEAGPSTVVEPPQNRLPTPPIETPRCIPLHGTLQQMHCQICTHSFPLRDYLPALNEGRPPYCPECSALEETRQLVGKRSRGVGKLRPSVVLYNEMHKDGRGGGRRRAARPDRKLEGEGPGGRGPAAGCWDEFESAGDEADREGVLEGRARTRRTGERGDAPIRAVYLNLDFPVPTREWEGVFDVWIRGDAQEFAQLMLEEMDRELRAKEEAAERKRRREEAALAAKLEAHMSVGVDPQRSSGSAKKRKTPSSSAGEGSAKKHKVTPPTPVSMKKPAGKARKSKSGGDDVLPVPAKESKRSSKPKSGLKIRIPPRPVVLITTPVPKPKRPALVTPEPSPPSSPLTPVPSSVSRHRSTLSPLSPILSPPSKPRSTRPYDYDWDDRGELTELSDNDSSDDEDAESYLPTFHRSPHGPGR